MELLGGICLLPVASAVLMGIESQASGSVCCLWSRSLWVLGVGETRITAPHPDTWSVMESLSSSEHSLNPLIYCNPPHSANRKQAQGQTACQETVQDQNSASSAISKFYSQQAHLLLLPVILDSKFRGWEISYHLQCLVSQGPMQICRVLWHQVAMKSWSCERVSHPRSWRP